jgi:leader peptidase (prepilin peptidase)/N-methyltransferase
MSATILLTILCGFIIGDVLYFAVFQICRLIEEEESGKKSKQDKHIIKLYINYVLEQIKQKNKNFITSYILMDIVTVSFTVFFIIHYGITKEAFAGLLFCYCLIVLTFIDAKTQYLPDIITKPLIVLGLIQGYFGVFTNIQDSVLGALIGYWSLWTINTTFRLIRKKDGMGQGDFKLLSAIGAWVGYQYLPFIIFASSFLGIFVALWLAKFANNKLSAPSPFGPSLSIAGVITLVWGADIINWYLSLLHY